MPVLPIVRDPLMCVMPRLQAVVHACGIATPALSFLLSALVCVADWWIF